TGCVVGASTPPSCSIVAATTAPDGTGSASATTVDASPPSKSPARIGLPPAGMTHASYVLPAGAAERRPARLRIRVDRHRPLDVRLCGPRGAERVRERGGPDAEADGDARRRG